MNAPLPEPGSSATAQTAAPAGPPPDPAHLRRLKQKLQGRLGTRPLLSLVGKSASGVELTEWSSAAVWQGEAEALRKLENDEAGQISAQEGLLLEAIVEKLECPVVPCVGGTFDLLPGPWTHFNAGEIRSRINAALGAVGQVEIMSANGRETTAIGTGMLVGERLVMTTRHLAEVFARGVGERHDKLGFKLGSSALIHTGRDAGGPSKDLTGAFFFTGVRMVHPYWDMALLELQDMPPGVAPLQLSVLTPEDMTGREIAVIGHPYRRDAQSPLALDLESSLFGDGYGGKRLAPGSIVGRELVSSFNHDVEALAYSSSTVARNSGAALLDVATGQLVGLHFRGVFLKGNLAVPTYELARDRHVQKAGVLLAGKVSVTTEWESSWQQTLEETQPEVAYGQRMGVPPQDAGLENLVVDTPATAEPAFFPEGLISQRLEALRQATAAAAQVPQVDRTLPYRHAAAVLAAFDPATLSPLGVPPADAPPGAEAVTTALGTHLTTNPYRRGKDDLPASVDSGARKTALQEMKTAKALKRALEANAARLPDVPVQHTLTRAIRMESFDVGKMTADELRVLAVVSDWLEGTEPGKKLPTAAELYLLIDVRRDRDLLHQLASDTFTGRVVELQRVRAHFEGDVPQVFFIAGQGGMGKSALISRALLDWEHPAGAPAAASAERRWVRIDMHHSLVEPEKPLSVFSHAAEQIARTYPELRQQISSFTDSIGQQSRRGTSSYASNFESTGAGDWGNARAVEWFLAILQDALLRPEQRLVLWLDTFEEAQFLGTAVESALLALVQELTDRQPHLRVLVSGRVLPAANSVKNLGLETLTLTDLPAEAAVQLLDLRTERVRAARAGVGP